MEAIILRWAAIIGALSVIGGVLGWLFRTLHRLSDGMKCLLRKDMMDTYYNNLDDEALHEYEKKNFLYEYNAYKALGGNSFIDDISTKVREWNVGK